MQELLNKGAELLVTGNELLKQVTEAAFGIANEESIPEIKKLLESKYDAEKLQGLKLTLNVSYSTLFKHLK